MPESLQGYLIALDSPRAVYSNTGSKGAALASLRAANFPLPEGFILSTAAYSVFINENGLEPLIQNELKFVSLSRPASLETAARSIYRRFISAPIPLEIVGAIQHGYRQLVAEVIADTIPRPAGPLAVVVRSSAAAKGERVLSFARQHESFINMRGEQAVLNAVRRCWASLWSANAISYRLKHDLDPVEARMAVIIQDLFPADCSGRLWTVHPQTNPPGQMLIETTWGLGEALSLGLVKPDRCVVEKSTGAVISYKIADKQTMTGLAPAGGTEEQPVPPDRVSAPVLNSVAVAELAALASRVEAAFGCPVEIEWARRAGQLTLLQASLLPGFQPGAAGLVRSAEGIPVVIVPGQGAAQPGHPVAAQAAPVMKEKAVAPETTGSPQTAVQNKVTSGAGETAVSEVNHAPVTWTHPAMKDHRYGRAGIAELLPLPLTPLFSTLGLKALNAGIQRIEADLNGSSKPVDDSLIMVNGYAYLNTDLSSADLPRLLKTRPMLVIPLLKSAEARWRDQARPNYASFVNRWKGKVHARLASGGLLIGTREVLNAAMDYYAALQFGILPAAYFSEVLFDRLYNQLIHQSSDQPMLTYLLGYDCAPILLDKSFSEIVMDCKRSPDLISYLFRTPARQVVGQIQNGERPGDVSPEVWEHFSTRLLAHLEHYGHAFTNLDFSNPVLEDDPILIIEGLRISVLAERSSPFERQHSAAQVRESSTQKMAARLGGIKKKVFRDSVDMAQKYAPLREDGLAYLSLGWPVIRSMLLELGRRLATAGQLEQPADIFWLTEAEVQQAATALDQGEKRLPDRAEIVYRRKAEWQFQKCLNPPAILSAAKPAQNNHTLTGAPVSPGKVTGTACVLRGPEDFLQLKANCILVAPNLTPAWAPLLHLCLGVVTELGGPAGNSSLAVRDAGIPAVFGAAGALATIQTGQQITVDGNAGVITLQK